MLKNYARALCAFGLMVSMFSAVSYAEEKGRIEGFVYDSKTKEPLPGANVLVVGTRLGAAADLKGKFVIPAVPAGSHTLVVTYIGYQKKSFEITVTAGQTLTQTVRLDFQIIEGEVVEVTAQAEGQLGAINQQLASNTISNIVSQARIKELPDVNAAESIGRLPGVAIQRTGGEANKISIRGLSPKYNTVTVNGVRVPSTDSNDRSVDLSLISSNMLDGIEVKKAITPDMDADAVGGAVDLRLREAPEEFSFGASVQGGYNRLQSHWGNPNINANISNRFWNGRFGIIASANIDDYDRSADKFYGGYRQGDDPDLPGQDLAARFVTDIGLREENVMRSRSGGSGLLDYHIPKGKMTLNGFYNRLKSEGLYRINNINVNSSRHYYDVERRVNTTSIFTGAFGVEQNFDWLRYDLGVARTASRSNSPEDFLWRFGQEGDIFRSGIQLPNEDTKPNEIPGLVKADTNTALHHIWVQSTKREENVTTTQLNLQAPFRVGNWMTGYFKTGGKLRWLNRRNDQFQRGRAGLQYGSGAGNLNDIFDQMLPQLPSWNLEEVVGDLGFLPIGLVLQDYYRANFLDGEYDLGFVANSQDMTTLTRALQATLDIYGEDMSEYRINSIGTLGSDYDGIERTKAAYAMAEFNLGKHVTLIPGVRYEEDYSKYHGQRYREIITAWRDLPPADFERLTNIRENSFWLPMVHLQMKPTDWMKIRLARTETLIRPDYFQYTPITTIDAFRSYIRAANGLLKPSEATNYDAAISVYQNKVGLLTLAGFSKTIDDLIISVNFPVSSLLIASTLPQGLNVPATWYQGVTPILGTYINNPFEARYKGFEIDWQTNFWYLPSFLKGIVLSANYTYIDSETEYQGYYLVDSDSIRTQRPRTYWKILITDSTRVGRMPDQPSHIANVTLGYDFKGFSARFSFLYQTDVSTYVDATNPLADNFSGDYARFDISLKQKVYPGVEVFANFNNLNSRADRNFRGASTSHPTYIEYYGLTMDGGVRVKF